MLPDYTRGLNAQSFPAILVREEGSAFYNARHGANHRALVGSWVKRWVHWDGRRGDLRLDNAPFLEIPSSIYT